jgi:hypothetical protein
MFHHYICGYCEDIVVIVAESRLEGGVNRANLKFTNLITTTSRVSVRSINESQRGRENKSQANKE